MKVVIMVGGKGTKLSELFPDIPKPLIPIENVPVLEREVISLRDQGFTDLILTVSHMHEKIEEYFEDGSRLDVKIEYFVEEIPLDNAGALFKLNLTEDFLLLNADAVFDVDFNRIVDYHRSNGGLVTLFTHPNSHPYDSGLIIASPNGAVDAWIAKEDESPTYYKNRVKAGLHVISPKILAISGIEGERVGTIDETTRKIIKADLDRQLLKPLSGKGVMFCYNSPEYCKDMGTPERYESVCKDFVASIVTEKNLSNPQKAISLDRDGTINKYVGFLHDISQLNFYQVS